ncbi:MAG TPA: CHAT domain-containing protein [Vicinamibacterales bacterium]|nr:CHAT domain-containing protein [Vicinamibacterales bacterium]
MPAPEYKEFDLEISRGPDDMYKVDVIRSPAGEAHETFKGLFEKFELENYLLKLGPVRRGVRRGPSKDTSVAEAFGTKLFTQVFCGKVGDRFSACLDQIDTRTIPGLRVSLRLVGVPELAQLPWEFLFHPDRRFIALSQRTPIVRYIDLPRPATPLQVAAPLRVLTVVASPSDYDQLDAAKEKQNVREALKDLTERGLVEGDLLEPATFGALQKRLRQDPVHVLHFIGHGSWDGDTGSLVFEGPDGKSAEIDADTLATLLCDHDPLRLVVLNACESAKSSPTNPYAGTAATLIRHGIPAVVAMQFDISDDAALQFSQAFYQAIADGYPAEAALAEARKAMNGQGSVVEWGTPVLFSRSLDGRLFDLKRVKRVAADAEQQDAQSERASEATAEEGVPSKRGPNPAKGEFSDQEGKTARERELEGRVQMLEEMYRKVAVENEKLLNQTRKK